MNMKLSVAGLYPQQLNIEPKLRFFIHIVMLFFAQSLNAQVIPGPHFDLPMFCSHSLMVNSPSIVPSLFLVYVKPTIEAY